MIPNPILRVLSTIQKHRVKALLMGGQACVFYGGAEFSRVTDLAILASPENLERLKRALGELKAECIAVPPFEVEYLERGHAVHFRCEHPDVKGMRVDVMSRLRGLPAFPELWSRRTTLTAPDGPVYEVLSLADLVTAKKTQRDKDWPMVRRLLEASYFQFREEEESPERLAFWLRELRTPGLLVEVAQTHRALAHQLRAERPLIGDALKGDEEALAEGLDHEEKAERARDREYWQPLKEELEKLRRKKRGRG